MGFVPEAYLALFLHSWKGNVRELEKVVTVAQVLASGEPHLTALVQAAVVVFKALLETQTVVAVDFGGDGTAGETDSGCGGDTCGSPGDGGGATGAVGDGVGHRQRVAARPSPRNRVSAAATRPAAR